MFRLILILIVALIVTYFLKSILKSILTLLNKNNSSPVIKDKKTENKQSVPYDKSKVVDAEFEEIK